MPAIADLSVANWHRLNRLLEAALALEADARSAWFSDLPASDADLLPLLQQLLSPKDLTETAQFAPLPFRSDGRGVEEQAGQLFGPYRLLRELGQGGMGTVWLAARADGAFERQVALKLPHAEWIDRGLAQRFARERAMLASLNHPNIAQLFDAGWSESGRPYLALEYVEGQPINRWRDEQRLDMASRLALFVAVIRAVAHAHARLIVHRDLKPTNVLVNAAGEVKLLDFGIAKLLVAENVAADETELTRMAGRALTLSYAAPEQILGQPISTAADIYALGVLLFELLTGERPYRLSRADVQRRSALEEAIVRVDAPAPSSVAKDKSTRTTLRGDLDAIVLKALKKAPEQRYETAAAFADDIKRYLAQLPVHAQRDSRAYRLRRFMVRNRFAVGAVSAVMVALAAGLSVALWQAQVARDEARRANLIKDFVLSIIQQADPVASRQTREADVALLATAESRIDKELESQPELALQMRRAIGEAYRNRGEYQRARAVLRKGIEQARGALPPTNLELLGAFVQMADEYVSDSRESRADLETAITHLRALGPAAQPMLADALTARHRNIRWTASWTEGVESALEAYRVARATGDEGRVLAAAADLGYSLLNVEDDKELVQLISDAWEFGTRSGRIEQSDPRRIIATAWYGFSLCRAGQQAEGLKLVQEAVDSARKYHGSSSIVTEVALGALGFTFWCVGDPKRALEPVREAYAIAVKREPPESENRSFRQSMLTNVLFELGLLDEVKHVMSETPVEAMKGSGSPTATPAHNLTYEAQVHLGLGDTQIAERLAEEAMQSMHAAGSMFMAEWVYGVLAQALYQNGKPERAETFAVASLEHGEFTAKNVNQRAWKLLLLGRIRLVLGKYQSALELADQALALYSERGTPKADDVSQVNYQRGRALLGLGRHKEAVEDLYASYDYLHKSSPGSLPEARLAYWYGQALIANGESARGRALVAAATPRLAASKVQLDRVLVADGKPTKSQK